MIARIPAHKAFANILHAECPEWVTAQVSICADDLVDLLHEQNDAGTIRDCYNLWLKRIGGKQNLDSYAATLQAGAR